MLVKLLEKFEDIFKPLGKEEVEKRAPYWEVRLYNTSKSRGPDAMLAKTFKVKGRSRWEVYNNISTVLGLEIKRFILAKTHKLYLIPGNNIIDDGSNLMSGWYTIEMSAEVD